MKRFAAFLGVLMVMIMLIGCVTSAAPPPDTTAGLQGQSTEDTTPLVAIEKLETFHFTAEHTTDGERTTDEVLHVTFFKVRDTIIGMLKCEHGMRILQGDDASTLRDQLIQQAAAKKEKTDKPSDSETPGQHRKKPNNTSAGEEGAGRMWSSLFDLATRHEGWRLS